MTAVLVLAAVWLVTAVALQALRPAAARTAATWGLAALGIPLLGFATWQAGPLTGFAVLATGAAALHFPLLPLWQRLCSALRRRVS